MELRLSGKCDVVRVKTHGSFELANVFVRFDHVASFVVNANHGVV